MTIEEIRDEISSRYHRIVGTNVNNAHETINSKIEIIMLAMDKLLEIEQKRQGENSKHNYI